MKISQAIAALQSIAAEYGDLPIVGGELMDDSPLRKVLVVNGDGMEVFPRNPNGVDSKVDVEGVFLA